MVEEIYKHRLEINTSIRIFVYFLLGLKHNTNQPSCSKVKAEYEKK